MKTSIPQLFALSVVLLIGMQGCINTENREIPDGKDFDEECYKECCYENEYEYYEKDQMIVIYKNPDDPEKENKVKDALAKHMENGAQKFDVDAIDIIKCGTCDSTYAELWKANEIETTIHAEGVSAGTGLKHRNVGEDGLAYYSVNFKMPIPIDTVSDQPPIPKEKISSIIGPLAQQIPSQGRKEIIIAVLDTGFGNLSNNNSRYLWRNPMTDSADGCYPNDSLGWNFIRKNGDISDDNDPTWHGTFVSQFIINEFVQSTDNFPQIMSLKTHDKNGSGTLFSSICAIHYAMDHGANIINASWGFYDDKKMGHPYLDSLITEALGQKGILFVTAAGNRINEVDTDLLKAGVAQANLRNIKYNHFYPARLNNTLSGNILTATTTSTNDVSPTQNYYSSYVDVGVKADFISPNFMMFNLPNIAHKVSGSSYATAILTGKIGAYLPKDAYMPNIDKISVLPYLQSKGLIFADPALTSKIKKGSYIEK